MIRIKIEIDIEVDHEEADELVEDIVALKDVLERLFKERSEE